MIELLNTIRTEVERQIEINKGLLDGQLKAGCLYAFHQILDFLDTLQEPEVDLEKEARKYLTEKI